MRFSWLTLFLKPLKKCWPEAGGWSKGQHQKAQTQAFMRFGANIAFETSGQQGFSGRCGRTKLSVERGCLQDVWTGVLLRVLADSILETFEKHVFAGGFEGAKVMCRQGSS